MRLHRWSMARLDPDRLEAGALAASWAPLSNDLRAEQFASRIRDSASLE